MASSREVEEKEVPLLQDRLMKDDYEGDSRGGRDLASRFWIESKKLWYIVGPAIFSRLASYSMLVITQAFAGHLGELELAAISIANNVIVGFDFGLLVRILVLFLNLIFFFPSIGLQQPNNIFSLCIL